LTGSKRPSAMIAGWATVVVACASDPFGLQAAMIVITSADNTMIDNFFFILSSLFLF